MTFGRQAKSATGANGNIDAKQCFQNTEGHKPTISLPPTYSLLGRVIIPGIASANVLKRRLNTDLDT